MQQYINFPKMMTSAKNWVGTLKSPGKEDTVLRSICVKFVPICCI